jgi:cleavage and polyadenylation specificity factor subunit 1
VRAGGARAGLQISQLPPRQRLDAPWPRHKIAIRATPLRACLYAEAGLFALLTARLAPARPFLPEEPGSEPQAAYAYALAGAAAQARPSAELHELRLLSPGGWGTVWRYALLPGEAALAVEAVRLRDATTGDTVPLLAVGTGFSAGEDYPCSGRVLLFEVRRPAGGAGGGWGGELVFAREFKGPVTALCSLEGHLLLSTGNRLETCTLSSATAVDTSAPAGGVASATTYKLARSAFYDGPSLVTSLSVVKSFVLLGDAQHSVQFVRYREDGRQLGLLGKDFGAAPVAAAEFLIAGSSLHLVAADGGGTLRAFTYTPADPGSWKGQKLLNWGALHVGDRAGAMLRARMPPPRPDDAAARQAVVYGTDAGGVGVLAPLALAAPLEPRGGGDAAAALRAVAAALGAGVAHGAGLNPGAFRRRYARVPPALGGGTPYGKQPALGAQGILDGDLLLEFGALPVGAQAAAAARAGVTRAQVLAALSDIARCSVMF